MKTELVSLDTASVEAEWLTELALDLSLAQKPIPMIHMHCDNEVTWPKIASVEEGAKKPLTCSTVRKSDYLVDRFTISMVYMNMGIRKHKVLHQYGNPQPKGRKWEEQVNVMTT